ncbi:MAG: hypothetical protein FJ291_00980 [Planctomycetes bacterium]|nr:hypothetical protein [Planctomycetota bacterium]
MNDCGTAKQTLRVPITVKTYPIPSAKYDELVCTAGVTEAGDFVRLYPINFRDLPFSKQYRKRQWIEVIVERHRGRDVRKESYRPHCESIRILGEPITTKRGDWSERARFALAKKAQSMEDLYDRQRVDQTSLGVLRPRKVKDLLITPDDPDWKPAFKEALKQARLWEDRTVSREPPRKVPFKFPYSFECDDARCKGHEMMIEDWEVGALFWRVVDKGASHEDAAQRVREKLLDELCGPDKETHLFVGTVLAHPNAWVVIGVFWPTINRAESQQRSFAWGPDV